MTRQARWEIVQREGGWIARLRGANGKVIASSASQLYTRERDAIRVVEIAVEAGGARVYRDERGESTEIPDVFDARALGRWAAAQPVIAALLAEDRWIQSIKELRSLTGAHLRQAKDAIDTVRL